MPTYDYRCRTCDDRFEVRRGLDEPEQVVRCSSGHDEVSRVFTAVGVSAGAPAPRSGGCCGGGCCG